MAYKLIQKIVVSIDLALTSCELSNFHSSLPSSLTSFHHLNPTKILPEIFFTNQKSKEFKITTKIKINASETPNIPKNKNDTIANALKNKVKNTIPGFFAWDKKLVKSILSEDDICCFWFCLDEEDDTDE